jgi:hypothetical protein
MPRNHEILGLRFEIAGLVLVLFATVWQGVVTDWLERNHRNWIAYEQNIVQSATLLVLRDLSLQLSEQDPQRRKEIGVRIADATADAYHAAIQERQSRRGVQRGQSSTSSTVRYCLLLIGAGMIVLGKWLVLRHKSGANSGRQTNIQKPPPKKDAT